MAISCGNSHLQLRASAQQHIRTAAAEIGFKYLRFHGILSDDMRLVGRDKNGSLRYNWQMLDELFDFMLAAKVRPFVELSFMPKALASGEQTVFSWKCNVTMPRSLDEWSQCVRTVLGHWVERYGIGEVRQWYFEVWNEPNLRDFFAGTQEDYFKLYQASASAVKQVDGAFRVGGPSSARGSWVEEFLAFCAATRTPVDFVSTHIYADDDAFFTTQPGFQSKYLGPDYIANVVKHVHEMVRGSAFPHIQIFWTEWNSSWHPDSPWRETANHGAFILRTIRKVTPYVDGFSYWVLTDVYEEGFYPNKAFTNMYGLVNLNGLRKPSYFAYHCLAILGNSAKPLDCAGLDDNLNGWRAVHRKGCDILLYYYQDWSVTLAPPSRTVTLSLTKMKRAAISRIDAANNNIIAAWNAMGAPDNPTPKQIDKLRSKNEFSPTRKVTIVKGMLNVTLQPGTVVLVRAT
jgi:xylan 1,4-beta-xylosidase